MSSLRTLRRDSARLRISEALNDSSVVRLRVAASVKDDSVEGFASVDGLASLTTIPRRTASWRSADAAAERTFWPSLR